MYTLAQPTTSNGLDYLVVSLPAIQLKFMLVKRSTVRVFEHGLYDGSSAQKAHNHTMPRGAV